MQAVLLEFENEASHYLHYIQDKQLRLDEQCMVGLTPSVRAYLQAQSIPCLSTLPFFDTDSHRQVMPALERICTLFRDQLPVGDGFLVPQTYRDSIVFYVRMFLAHLIKKIEILHRLDQQERIDRWVACRYGAVNTLEINPNLQNHERYVGDVTCAFARRRGYPVIDLMLHPPLSALPDRETGSSVLNAVIRRLYTQMFRKLSTRSTAVVTNLGYEMDTVVNDLRRKFPHLTWLWLDLIPRNGNFLELKKCLKRRDRMFRRNEKGPFAIPLNLLRTRESPPSERKVLLARTLESRIRDIIESRPEHFSYRSISLKDWLIQKLNRDIIPYMVDLYEGAAVVNTLLTELKPAFVLSQVSADLYCALGELCAKRGIPAVLISHGSSVPAREPEARIEHDHISRRLIHSTYPYVALQSPWAAKFADEMAIPGRRLRTGPLIWSSSDAGDRSLACEELRAKILTGRNGHTKIILHASAPRIRQAHHFFICETQDEYIQSLTDLIHAIEGLEECHLVIRFRPQPPMFSTADLLDLLPKFDRLSVVTEGRFSEVLPIADLLISFYSATVEEALHNQIPVLLYGGRGRYMHLPATPISSSAPPEESAVYFVAEEKYLKPAIHHILRIHDRRPLDRRLLKSHCFERDDITPLHRYVSGWIR